MPVAHSNMPISVVKFFMKKGAVDSCCCRLALTILLFRYNKYTNREGMTNIWDVDSSLRALLKIILKSCEYRAITTAAINDAFKVTAIRCWFCVENARAFRNTDRG